MEYVKVKQVPKVSLSSSSLRLLLYANDKTAVLSAVLRYFDRVRERGCDVEAVKPEDLFPDGIDRDAYLSICEGILESVKMFWKVADRNASNRRKGLRTSRSAESGAVGSENPPPGRGEAEPDSRVFEAWSYRVLPADDGSASEDAAPHADTSAAGPSSSEYVTEDQPYADHAPSAGKSAAGQWSAAGDPYDGHTSAAELPPVDNKAKKQAKKLSKQQATQTASKQTQKKNVLPRSADARAAADAAFAVFWAAYPKKAAKPAAASVFHRLSPDDALFAALMAGLERQKRSMQWLAEDGRYIPYPATWLDQRRWEDEFVSSACVAELNHPVTDGKGGNPFR